MNAEKGAVPPLAMARAMGTVSALIDRGKLARKLADELLEDMELALDRAQGLHESKGADCAMGYLEGAVMEWRRKLVELVK